MPDLILHVKKKYFDEIKQGIKKEEYRLCKFYWMTRLYERWYEHHYDHVVIVMGYSKREDKENWLTFPYRGFEVKTIKHEEWFAGAKPVRVFAIKLEK